MGTPECIVSDDFDLKSIKVGRFAMLSRSVLKRRSKKIYVKASVLKRQCHSLLHARCTGYKREIA